jgi:NTP pyrophosphatase (non-canonical NTP hydrolase)
VKSLNELAHEIYLTSVEHGFWEEGDNRNRGEMIALMHSELSEALEAVRHGNPTDQHCPQFSSLQIELADCIIRILDLAYAESFDMDEAIRAKMDYNKTRPYKHAKEF